MEFEEGKRKFVNAWGTLGSSWGINKTMAQIHALLMISPEPLTTDDIMSELGISRGNVSMSIKGLMDWGIVHKEFKQGDRKDYFRSEKDVWKLSAQVAKERRRRELEPIIDMLAEMQDIKLDKSNAQQEFGKMTTELNKFAQQTDSILAKFFKMESNWFFSKALKLFS